MTREEAIREIQNMAKFNYTLAPAEVFDMAIKSLEQEPCEDAVEREKIKLLGEELRKVREGITDEKVLIGYNMAIAICNKYLAESEDKE